jgi:hypothetical protein
MGDSPAITLAAHADKDLPAVVLNAGTSGLPTIALDTRASNLPAITLAVHTNKNLPTIAIAARTGNLPASEVALCPLLP